MLYFAVSDGADADQSVFDPLDDFMNVTDNGAVFISEMFHRDVGAPVLEGDQESVFDA